MNKSALRAWFAPVVLLILGSAVRAQDAPVADVRPDPDEETRLFVAGYEAAVNGRDIARINATLDASRLIERARHGLAVPPALLEGFRDGVRSGLDWGRSLASGLGDSGHYRLLRLHREGDEQRALLRFVNAHGGLNYHDILIERGEEGDLAIVDVHVYLSGELLSETLRRSLRQILGGEQGGGNEYLDAVGLLEEMTSHAQAGAYADALAVYERMPAVMQTDKTVLIMRISCATESRSEELDQACRDFRAIYPDDPCVDLLTIDRLIMAERWPQAIEAFQRIDRVVGGDAYIDDLLAKIHLQSGDTDRARTLARRSIDRDPTLDAGYWTLLEISLARRDHEATARLLSTLEDNYGWRFEDLGGVETYADFVASPAYTQWQSSRDVAGVAG